MHKNRFSQDLELIDNDLPQSIDSFIFQFMSAIVSAVFVFIGSGYVAAAIPACLALLILLQFYYLRTSRQLRLLDIEAKAPLFSQFLETVNGIACIRAYGWTQNYSDRNYNALNASQKPFYLLYCIQRWLTLVLDLFNAGVAIMLVGIATNIQNGSTSFLGVALFNIVTFSSTLQTLVTAWTQVEMALGAINRIRSFVKTVKDENVATEIEEVPEEWPQHGAISFTNVSASYETSSEPVLKDISFSIQPGEKIAICGRTGRSVSHMKPHHGAFTDSFLVASLLSSLQSCECWRLIPAPSPLMAWMSARSQDRRSDAGSSPCRKSPSSSTEVFVRT